MYIGPVGYLFPDFLCICSLGSRPPLLNRSSTATVTRVKNRTRLETRGRHSLSRGFRPSLTWFTVRLSLNLYKTSADTGHVVGHRVTRVEMVTPGTMKSLPGGEWMVFPGGFESSCPRDLGRDDPEQRGPRWSGPGWATRFCLRVCRCIGPQRRRGLECRRHKVTRRSSRTLPRLK